MKHMMMKRDYPKPQMSSKMEKVHKVMSEFKMGELHMGKSKKKVKKRKQAIAIALSSARISKK